VISFLYILKADLSTTIGISIAAHIAARSQADEDTEAVVKD
jgi:hypothetical protein